MKHLLTLTAVAACISAAALSSCDSGPIDATGGAFDISIARFGDTVIDNPFDLAQLPIILKEGDVLMLTATTTLRPDDDIEAIAYESDWTVTNTRQADFYRRPPGFDPATLGPRTASWNRGGDDTTASLSTTTFPNEIEFNALVDSSLRGQNSDLRASLEMVDDSLIIGEEQAEDIEDAFQAIGYDVYNNFGATAIKIIVRREIRFTATSDNLNTTDTQTITGFYDIIEFTRDLKFIEWNDSGFLEVYLGTPAAEQIAETGTFTLTLNGLGS